MANGCACVCVCLLGFVETARLAAVFADPVLKRPPAGLRYHITDLFVSELTAVDAQVRVLCGILVGDALVY